MCTWITRFFINSQLLHRLCPPPWGTGLDRPSCSLHVPCVIIGLSLQEKVGHPRYSKWEPPGTQRHTHAAMPCDVFIQIYKVLVWVVKQLLRISLRDTGSGVPRALWGRAEGRNPKPQLRRSKQATD